ncbi:MAG: hypothetical protein IJH04_04755, partial [Eggerthellaceae bacterium]|nr:hypothetical protein [Eggerthellaceae bacterium]
FMNNHDLELDDMVTLGGKRMRITGVLTLPDYQAMFKGNNDFMFDALTFTVGLVGGNGYEGITGTESFVYPFSFVDKSLDLTQRTEIEEDMLDALNDNDAMISDFLDANDNQAIGYAMDDVVGDQAMWTALLFILIVIMAFVFVVLTGATIEQESSVIGTMLASGWRKGELIRHYLLLPAIIGFLACAIGLAIGVTVLDGPMKDLYYNSYSLPPFETIWNWRIVLITAVLPYVMLIGITFVGLARKLRFTPLQFLRHEVAGRNHAARIRLPQRLPYPVKFRTRVIVRNASHFVTLFCGIMFASLLLLFGTCMLPVVAEYANQLRETVKAPYEYVLKTPLELDGSDEEREMYAAALRLASDRERMDANKDVIDAAKRLRDNTELMDALERLMDNTELLEAVERLQEDQELMDAIERLRDRQDLLDAAERLQDQQYVIDAAQRLESKRYMIAAAQRLQSKQDIIAAAQRLQSKQDLVAAAQRMQEHPEVIAAAQHAQEGTATEEELMLLASLDEQTRADMELVASMDDQTRSDMEKAASMDEQTKRDIETVSKMDAQTKRDIQTVSNMSAQTRADIELISNLDQQTKDDLELLSNLEGQAKDDLQLIMDADQQTKDDIELLSNLDQATKDDIELVKDMDRDLLDDLRLAGKIDEDAHVVNTQVNDPGVLANTEKYAVGSLE